MNRFACAVDFGVKGDLLLGGVSSESIRVTYLELMSESSSLMSAALLTIV